MPDTVLGPGDIALNKAVKVPVINGPYSQIVEIKIKNPHKCKQIEREMNSDHGSDGNQLGECNRV